MNSLLIKIALIISALCLSTGTLADITLPNDTLVRLATNEAIVAKKSKYSVGDVIEVRVWRDVIVGSEVLIKAGTPAIMQVDSIKARGIAGRKGKVSFAAISTTTVDGQKINLSGGYNKGGKGRIALTATLSAFVFAPAIFVPGGVPKFPEDTIFNAYVSGSYNVDAGGDSGGRRVVNLSHLNDFSAEIDYDALSREDKPKRFILNLENAANGQNFVIDRVNGREIDPIDLDIEEAVDNSVKASVSIKKLNREFQKGINRFDVSYQNKDERIGAEIIMEIEI